MMRKLLNSLPGRLVCAAAVLFMVMGLFVGAVGVADELHQAKLPGCYGKDR